MDLLLVRHGETDHNRDRRAQGMTDNPLNAAGLEQARHLGQHLARRRIDAIYSSGLRRARHTADVIASVLGQQVLIEDDLRELHQGELDGLTGEEMRARYPDILHAWATDGANVQLPGGESMQQCQDRVWGVIEGLRERHPDGAVLVVSHNLAILGAVCRALGLYLSHFRRLRLDNAAVTELSLQGDRISLRRFNDTCHLHSNSAVPSAS